MSDNFNDIMERLKLLLKVHSDTAIAEMLEISQSTFAERKKRKSIPYDRIIALCDKKGISVDWLFYGQSRDTEGSGKSSGYRIPILKSIAGEAPSGAREGAVAYEGEATISINIKRSISEHNRPIIERMVTQLARIISEGDISKTSAIRSMLDALDPENKKKEEE